MAQFARPTTDTTRTNWEEDDGTTTAIYDQVDEAVRDDADYIRTGLIPNNAIWVTKFGSLTDPATGAGHILRYVLAKDAADGEQIDFIVQLRQGYTNEGSPGTLIQEWLHPDVSGTLTLYEQTLGEANANLITDYTSLYYRVSCSEIVPPEVAIKDQAPAAPTALRTVNVSTVGQLNTAITNAIPGDRIVCAAGTYNFATLKVITLTGTAANPIVIQGAGPTTILTCGPSQALDLNMCSYVQLRNLRITNNFFGLRLKGAQNIVIDTVTIDTTGQEAMSVRREGTARDSAFVYIQNCAFSNTGTANASGQFAEGVYVGGTLPDATHDIYILACTFDCRANAIDFSAGTSDCWVEGCTVDGTNTVWLNGTTVGLVDLRGPRHTIVRNTLRKGNPHCINVWQDSGHVIRLNILDVQDIHSLNQGYGIRITGATGFWGIDNTFQNLPAGGGTITGGSLS